MFIQRSAAERTSKVLGGFADSLTDGLIRGLKCQAKFWAVSQACSVKWYLSIC